MRSSSTRPGEQLRLVPESEAHCKGLWRRDTSVLSRKFVCIRTPLHPARPRCSSSTYLPDTPSSSHLVGRANRRPRCDDELPTQDTSVPSPQSLAIRACPRGPCTRLSSPTYLHHP